MGRCLVPSESVSTVGSGGDYSTIELWQSGITNKNLVSRDVIEVAEVIGGSNVGNPTNRVFLHSWTTDATRYPLIRAQAGSEYRGTGALDTSKAYMQADFSSSNQGLVTTAVQFHIEDIQLDLTSQANGMKVWYNYIGGGFTAKRCLFRNTVDIGATGTFDGLFIEQRNPSIDGTIQNCIFIGEFAGNANACQAVYFQGASGPITQTLYNNTFVVTGGNASVKSMLSVRDSHTFTCDNNYFAIPSNSTGNIYNPFSGGVINKGANDATTNLEATTASRRSQGYTTLNFSNVTSGTEDLTPVSTGGLFDVGTDLTAQGITIDIQNVARPDGAGFDIGAVELEDPLGLNTPINGKGPNYRDDTLPTSNSLRLALVLTTPTADVLATPLAFSSGYTAGGPLIELGTSSQGVITGPTSAMIRITNNTGVNWAIKGIVAHDAGEATPTLANVKYFSDDFVRTVPADGGALVIPLNKLTFTEV